MSSIEPRIFWFSHRVSYRETDKMGIVYYGEYLHFFERARTEYLREVLGYSYYTLEEKGYFLPVCHVDCTYKHSIAYDDIICIKTWINEWKKASLTFAYEVYSEDKTILHAYATTLLACVDSNTSLQKFPQWLCKS